MKIKPNKIFFIKKIPIISSLLLITVSYVIPVPVGYAFNLPFVPILCLIGWTLLISNYFGIINVFLLGIFSDLLSGSPLGSNALLFILIYIVVNFFIKKFSNNKLLSNFLLAGSAIVIFYILQLLFIIIYFGLLPDLNYFLFNLLLSIALYPTFYVILVWLHKYIRPNFFQNQNV